MLRFSVQRLRPVLFVAALVLVSLAFLLSQHAVSPVAAATPPTYTCAQIAALQKFTGGKVPTPTSLDKTCAQIPFTPAGSTSGSGEGAESNQVSADLYSWLTFVALNWPVNAGTCAPNAGVSILTDPLHPTWLSYLNDTDVFKPSGAPDPWCGGPAAGKTSALSARLNAKKSHLSPAVVKLANAHPEVKLFLSHSSKSGQLLSSMRLLKQTTPSNLQSILQSTGLPLVDQNGRFVRFSVSLNEDELNYINSKQLYTNTGQKQAGALTFPSSNPTTDFTGAMELKAAWKVLGPNDDASHFFTQQAIVYNDSDGQPSPGKNPVTVGLVGLHIIHKALGQPNWTWSTFEQVDNDTVSFFNPHCVPPAVNPNKNDCVVNSPTAQGNALELSSTGQPLNFPTQVQPKVPSSNPGVSQSFQKLLAKTPWSYYTLISTQWSGGAVGIVPEYLGASVQETFVAKNDSKGHPLDSCAFCHVQAQDSAGFPSDRSFMIYTTQR